MRSIRLLLAFALPLMALPCSGAHGATTTVMAVSTPDNAFTPQSAVVSQGDTVTWTTDGADRHNVRFEEFSYVMPDPPSMSASDWPVSETFTQPGTYHYYCEVHGGPGGMGMSGTIVVKAASGGGGGAGGGGSGTPPPIADVAPVTSLAGPSKQRVGKLFVRASMNEAGTLTAAGTVSLPGGAARLYKFKRARAPVAANQSVKLRLKLAKKALRAVRRALRHGKRLRAKVAVTARDMTGHETVRKQTIRLKR